MRFRNYRNRHNKKNRIYSVEELLSMTLNDLLDDEPAILAQDKEIGIPNYEELRQSPNTRWIDKYTDEYGQQHGGYYGSISDYDESFAPKQKFPNIDEGRYKNYPIYMSESDTPAEEDEEESPIVLEGKVQEDVYYPEETNQQEEDNKDKKQSTEEDGTDDVPENNPFELGDEDLLKILQDMLTGSVLNSKEHSSAQNIWRDSQRDILFDYENEPRYNITIPTEDSNNTVEQLRKIIEELMKKLRLGKWSTGTFSTGNITGGAASINNTTKDASMIRNSKSDLLRGMFNDYKSLQDPVNTALYVLGEFITNYNSMKDADVHGGDKYFHAKANYEAAQQGIVGSAVAKIISDLREWNDAYRNVHQKGYTKEYSDKDIEGDQKANDEGRELGRKYPTKPPYEALEHIKPKGLPNRYQKRW